MAVKRSVNQALSPERKKIMLNCIAWIAETVAFQA
jgi:hypothetical protein